MDFYQSRPDFVVPDFRFNEIKQFVKSGLQDFSISRLKSKMSWGVPVPGDDKHVMYVWFDALINYISTLGWPNKDSMFAEFWPGLQIGGKDNLRQQSAMWQAMLMSAGLPNSKQIIIHGFINSGGQKMSKSLGNVADPYDIIAKLKEKGLNDEQATDALRYYLLREIPTFEDGDYTWEKFVEAYNAGLANGIGNLTSRILKMVVSAGIKPVEAVSGTKFTEENYTAYLEKYQNQKAIDEVWKQIAALDLFIQREEPFKKIKVDFGAAKEDLLYLLDILKMIGYLLKPFLPSTSEKILQALKEQSLENIPRLFPRIEV